MAAPPPSHNGTLPIGKFNAGQKLNANFQLGGILMMLSTGLVMRFANHLADPLRTGATFVHDWMAYAILAVVRRSHLHGEPRPRCLARHAHRIRAARVGQTPPQQLGQREFQRRKPPQQSGRRAADRRPAR